MAKENETVADIIAEMRIFKCRNLETGELESCNAIANYFADRLEAAYKRELDALNEQIADLRQQRDLWSKRAAELVEKCNEQYAKLKQVGNAAKLREALVSVQKKIHYLIGSLNVPNSLVANRMEINGIINAALAAPPRNCDEYANHNDAMQAFDAFVREQGKLGFINPYTEAFKWLFATTTEKEGGAK